MKFIIGDIVIFSYGPKNWVYFYVLDVFDDEILIDAYFDYMWEYDSELQLVSNIFVD
jgi:hypothetical protein